jgi:UDP-N-acetylmuramyl pentapeptide phosphotransferase/UDP-N-acetylglucosamine-1-phosphate transferase
MNALASDTLILALSAASFAWVGTYVLVLVLPRLALIDTPNERSNHASPTPRGGGAAVVFALIFFLTVTGVSAALMLAIFAVASISLLDDWKGQPAIRRLLVHLIAAVLAVSTLEKPVFQGWLPLVLDQMLASVLLAYFLNLFNFMDGIDELTSMQTVSLCTGLTALAVSVPGVAKFIAVDATVVAGAVMGFWYFNRHPARIFLGDVGSVTLGMLTGYLLLALASQGQWAAAVILPAYYLVDASLTLIRRWMRGAPLMQAHSEHAYQRAVRRGYSHRRVVRTVLALNILLVMLAAISTLSHWLAIPSIASAYVGAGAVYLYLYGRGGPRASKAPVNAHA